jgi:hypothetical protein
MIECHSYHTTYLSQSTWDLRNWVKKFNTHRWF